MKHSNGKYIRDFNFRYFSLIIFQFSNVVIQNYFECLGGISSLVMCNFASSNREDTSEFCSDVYLCAVYSYACRSKTMYVFDGSNTLTLINIQLTYL